MFRSNCNTVIQIIAMFGFFTVCLLCHPPAAYSHAVRGAVSQQNGMQVRALYDGGDPMTYAAVEVKHADDDLPFQTGRTDRNGRFMFLPDKAGKWQVQVTDGMGHRLSLSVEVDPDLALNKRQANRPGEDGPGRYAKALTGVAIIFFIFGLFFWWRGASSRRMN